MSGRMDYEERKQSRIDRLNNAAYKASTESDAAIKRSYDLTKDIPLGQPNINGALTGIMNKSRNAADRSVKYAEKATYYANRAEVGKNNHMISSDDPQAIIKLKEKLSNLEAQREKIKAKNKKLKKAGKNIEPAWILTNLGATIRTTKKRIARLEQVDQMPAEAIKFDGGEIISDVATNRIIIRHDEKPDTEIIQALKNNGFHWARSESAWMRLRNLNALNAAKIICGVK